MSLVKLSSSDLSQIKYLYKIDWPRHIVTYNTLSNIHDRIIKNPELNEKVDFWSLSGDCRKHGTFVMIKSDVVYFDSLESKPNKELKETLKLINFTSFTMFFYIRDDFKQLVYEVIEQRRLNMLSERVCDAFCIPKEFFQNLEIE